MEMTADTIFALASGSGRAGVAVFRLSGPRAGTVVKLLCGGDLPRPRYASLRWLSEPGREGPANEVGASDRPRREQDGARIDQGLVIWFPGPASFTGEDVAEFHLHGGVAVVSAFAAMLARMEGVRVAEAGEFTRRAFDNGKLDLTEVEGLADLIGAETEMQRRQALRQLGGGLTELCGRWREELVAAAAFLTAEIDFADEELPDGVGDEGVRRLAALRADIERHLADSNRGEILRRGVRVAILGVPNAGKSSLLNRLARREVAIVSSEAGTTRDIIEVHLDLAGMPVIALDTAGLRAAENAVEQEGVRRALAAAEEADIRLLLLDGESWPEFRNALQGVAIEGAMVVVSKADMLSHGVCDAVRERGWLPLSAKTGEGVDALLELLSGRISAEFAVGDGGVLTRSRHRAHLRDCLDCLEQAAGAARQGGAVELIAEDVRRAGLALGRITGQVDVEDILDVVFGEFCIGK